MAPLKLFLTCSALASAELGVQNCEVQGDQTALLQSHLSRKGELSAHHTAMLHFPSLGNLKDPRKRRSSLAQFEQTATQLVQDRAAVTPGLVALAESIVGMLQGTLDVDTTDPSCGVGEDCGALGSILEEHDNDENLIDTEFNMFAPYHVTWSEIKDSVAVYNSTDTTTVGSKANLVAGHTTCRATEDVMCSDFGDCKVYEAILQAEVDELEEELVEIDGEINEKWCVVDRCDEVEDGDCNDHLESVFRQGSKESFLSYNAKLGELNTALKALDIQSAYCVTNGTAFDAQRHTCNGKQDTFQSATCQHEQIVEHDIEDLRASWNQAYDRYENTLATIIINVYDRKIEWTTVRKVVCLLNELSKPLETPTSGSSYNTDAIEACHNMSVNTDHLDMNALYPAALGLPLASDLVDTCSQEFVDDYYGDFGQCLDKAGAAFSTDYILASKIGAAESCVCEHNTIVHFDNIMFPHSLVSYMLRDSSLLADPDQPNEAEKFSWAPATNTWSMTVGGEQHSGGCSSQTLISASSKAAHGLTEAVASAVTHYAWCYPEAADPATSLSTAMSLVRMGSFVYTTGEEAGSSALAIRTLEPWHFDKDSAPGFPVIHWQAPVSITSTDFDDLCHETTGKVSSDRLREEGADLYCWVESPELASVGPACKNGCFAFKLVSDQYSVYGAVE